VAAAAPRVVSFVPPQKQPGLALFFKELKLLFRTEDVDSAMQQLVQAISTTNSEVISEDFLKGLSDAMKVLKPHIDEARSYDGDLSVLTQFDRMCCYLSGLEDAEKVIADWYYRRVQVYEEYSECNRAISDLHETFTEILCREWKEVLRILLAVGNHLNPQRVDAFVVSKSLGYIATFPASRKDGEGTKYGNNMMETVVEYISRHHPRLLDIDKQMKTVVRAESLSLRDVQNRIQSIKDQVDYYKDVLGLPKGNMANVLLQNISPSDVDVKLMKDYSIDTAEYNAFITTMRRRVAKMHDLGDLLGLFTLLNQIAERDYVGDAMPILTERILLQLFTLPLTETSERAEIKEVVSTLAKQACNPERQNFVRIAASKVGLIDVDHMFPKGNESSATSTKQSKQSKKRAEMETDPTKKVLLDFIENAEKLIEELDTNFKRMRANLNLVADRYGQDNLKTSEDALHDLLVAVSDFLGRWQATRKLHEKVKKELDQQKKRAHRTANGDGGNLVRQGSQSAVLSN
jgi:hypothetical protein